MLTEGQRAPDFALPDMGGKAVKLTDFSGLNVVLYFYPKDMTTGCTTEACGFRDFLPRFTDSRVKIIGVSMDSPESHQRFAQKYGLTFTLLSDQEGRVCKRYGVYQKKNLYGREVWGVKRTTFLIGKDGTIRKVYRSVDVDSHHRDVLQFFEGD